MASAPPSNPHNNATATIQHRYNRQAGRYDLLETPAELLWRRWRRRLWERTPPGSRVLEVGVGTGKNISWYPPEVLVTAVDFSPKMLARAAPQSRQHDPPPALALMDAQALGFADDSFDVAVATCVFCSVPDPVLGLREVRRVLRPGGLLLLLEHVRSGLPLVGRLMDFCNPVTVGLQGVNINRNTLDNVKRAGFDVLEVDDMFLDIVKLIVAQPAAENPA
jgi:ubiquinone/menaquinone biosynthesis C-methylase UbiE